MRVGDIKRKSSLIIALVMCVLLFVVPAGADVIIDTGGVPNPAHASILFGNDPGHASWAFQWLAGKITLDRAYTITDIEGWISTSEPPLTEAKLTMVVYGDAGGPDKENELYFGVFDVPVQHPFMSDWRGVHGLSLVLETGSYWLALETRDGFGYSGYMEECGPDLLSSYAYAYHYNPDYTQWLGYQGFKVQGIPLNVPEPATMLLLGLGLVGLAGLRRFKN